MSPINFSAETLDFLDFGEKSLISASGTSIRSWGPALRIGSCWMMTTEPSTGLAETDRSSDDLRYI